MSLRRRLVVGMLLLLVAGLITTDFVTSSSLRSFLVGRIDEQVESSQHQAYAYIYQVLSRDVQAGDRQPITDPQTWLAELSQPSTAPGEGPGGLGAVAVREPRLSSDALSGRVSSDAYVEVITANGRVVFRDPSGLAGHPDPAPVLPRSLPVQRSPRPQVFGKNHGPYAPDRPSIDVAAVGSTGIHYRAEALAVPGGTLVTAISLDPTEQTLASLTHVEWLVSIVVILALLLLSLWIVRLGLRPLDDMTKTAGAIAHGDLTRRIRRSDERSEVGRLGSALNGMLSQIEAAFGERTASESRLRRFVADASHELRTPLTSIRGYAELLRKGGFDTEEGRRRAAERIEGEAARMSLLVDDLLLLARLDQGRPLERAPVDLRRVVADAVDAARMQDPTRPLTLDVDGSVVVQGDAARVRQIVDNLLGNALIHTPERTPVHVAVERRGHTARLTVADEGPGLDAEQAAQVFDRFYRGSEARTGEGTGLGLSIVAALAAAHGGGARIETAPRRGTTFIVEIPAEVRSARATPVDGPVSHADGAHATAQGAGDADTPESTDVSDDGDKGSASAPSSDGRGDTGTDRLAPSVRR
jgi:two-component system OmpR family sensor kinase